MTSLSNIQNQALLISLIKKMAEIGSWNGETHIQKATYFLKALIGVPMNYEFVMYKHGPYSFDLHDEMVGLKAKGFLSTIPQGQYGPSFRMGEYAETMINRYPKTINKFRNHIDFISEELSSMGIDGLEKIATALYMSVNNSEEDSQEVIASEVNQLKPHISVEEAQIAVGKIFGIKERARQNNLLH